MSSRLKGLGEAAEHLRKASSTVLVGGGPGELFFDLMDPHFI